MPRSLAEGQVCKLGGGPPHCETILHQGREVVSVVSLGTVVQTLLLVQLLHWSWKAGAGQLVQLLHQGGEAGAAFAGAGAD
jgi:hypothetical protein